MRQDFKAKKLLFRGNSRHNLACFCPRQGHFVWLNIFLRVQLMRSQKPFFASLPALVMAVLLTACGGGETPSTSQKISVQTFADVPSLPIGQGPYDRQVQEMYIAYYGRPADPGGLGYWSNRIAASGGSLSGIIQEFGNSAESDALYKSLGTEGAVTALYQQQFGRAPDTDGLNYYVSNINNGTFSLVTVSANIFYGAPEGSDDKRMLENKVQVANEFTEALRLDPVKLAAYSGNAAAALARGNLSEVRSNEASVASASSRLGSLYNSLIALAPSNTEGTGAGETDSNDTSEGTNESPGVNETSLTQAQKNSAFIVNAVVILH